MNRRMSIVSALVISGCASSSFAGFSVTATRVVVAGLDRYDIVAVNTGGDTGTQIKALEYFYSGSPAFFQVDDVDDGGDELDDIPDTVNLLSTSRTRIRVSTTGANNVFVGVVPTNGWAQPNPYEGGITAFQGAIANTGTTQATGAGFQIARIFLPTSGSGVFSGNLGGDIGNKVPFSVNLRGSVIPPPPPPPIPVINPPSQTVNVVFGSIVSESARFSASVAVTSPDAGSVLSLVLGVLPAGLSGVRVEGAAGPSPRVFNVAGGVDYRLNGTDVVIPIVATDGFLSANGSITLHVTPEPVSVAWLGLVASARRTRSLGRG